MHAIANGPEIDGPARRRQRPGRQRRDVLVEAADKALVGAEDDRTPHGFVSRRTSAPRRGGLARLPQRGGQAQLDDVCIARDRRHGSLVLRDAGRRLGLHRANHRLQVDRAVDLALQSHRRSGHQPGPSLTAGGVVAA